MKLTLKHALAAIILTLSFAPPVAAVELQADSPPPETPDATYGEIVACLAEKGAFRMPVAAFQAANEDCMSKAQGLTRFEFVGLVLGCGSIDGDKARAFCGSGVDKKLRPGFTHGAPPPSVQELTASEFVAIESGCPSLRDPEKARCLSGVKKLRTLLVGAPLPNALDHNTLPLVTPQEYLRIVKAAPYWITSPRGDSVWLLDPMGRLVIGKDGMPVSVPFK